MAMKGCGGDSKVEVGGKKSHVMVALAVA